MLANIRLLLSHRVSPRAGRTRPGGRTDIDRGARFGVAVALQHRGQPDLRSIYRAIKRESERTARKLCNAKRVGYGERATKAMADHDPPQTIHGLTNDVATAGCQPA